MSSRMSLKKCKGSIKHPQIAFHILPHLGDLPDLTTLIADALLSCSPEH